MNYDSSVNTLISQWPLEFLSPILVWQHTILRLESHSLTVSYKTQKPYVLQMMVESGFYAIYVWNKKNIQMRAWLGSSGNLFFETIHSPAAMAGLNLQIKPEIPPLKSFVHDEIY